MTINDITAGKKYRVKYVGKFTTVEVVSVVKVIKGNREYRHINAVNLSTHQPIIFRCAYRFVRELEG